MKGRILAVAGDTVTIEPERPAACFGCLESECKRGFAPVQARMPGELGNSDRSLEPGQRVEAVLPRKGVLLQALTALLTPLAGFISGYALTGLALPQAGEGPQAAGGAAAMFLFSLGLYLFRRRFPAKDLLQIKSVLVVYL
jgi:sigma-E factor negative regulatory protein RseC